ncbi:unnamed protein product [Plasmodium vivax]|uniref:(malaria parasite P. vivax) hypothetical protein n=1 Tax=Plasmodium vivax TaxID=5855 RepID=A0A8S4H268_PLAVI|nr:unnamed protein product [Plasmodium vivax]
MSNEEEFTLDKIKDEHNFMKNSKFYEIYDAFHKKCDEYYYDNKETCYTGESGNFIYSTVVNNILEELYSNLYRVNVTIKHHNNTYLENIYTEDKKMCCIALKYWLYDQIMTKVLEENKINEIFTGWKTYLKDKIKKTSPDVCTFNNLKKDEIKKLKNIYALYTIFYDNTNISKTCNNDKCKYIDYFGKGLDDFINGIKTCSSDSANNEYCNEFNEFIELCKEDNENAGISIYDEKTKSNAETAKKYLLFSEKYKNEQLYIYIKDTELLNFVKTSDFLSNKNSTIAATSVVGSAIGLSSIFYYFFKVILNDIFKYKIC